MRGISLAASGDIYIDNLRGTPAAGILAPSVVTGNLLAEYSFSNTTNLKLNVLKVGNKFCADLLYNEHDMQFPVRSGQATLAVRF